MYIYRGECWNELEMISMVSGMPTNVNNEIKSDRKLFLIYFSL